MNVQIVPYSWEFQEHLVIWRKSVSRGSLIPWSLARDYFVKTKVSLDETASPPILGPAEPFYYEPQGTSHV